MFDACFFHNYAGWMTMYCPNECYAPLRAWKDEKDVCLWIRRPYMPLNKTSTRLVYCKEHFGFAYTIINFWLLYVCGSFHPQAPLNYIITLQTWVPQSTGTWFLIGICTCMVSCDSFPFPSLSLSYLPASQSSCDLSPQFILLLSQLIACTLANERRKEKEIRKEKRRESERKTERQREWHTHTQRSC